MSQLNASLHRLYGMLLRQLYLIKGSPPRIISYIFWPTVAMLTWGFLNKYLQHNTSLARFSMSTLLGATLLLNFFERTNLQVMMGFLEEIWSRNIGNILITPIRTYEMLFGFIANAMISVLIGMSFACGLAWLIFDYSIFQLGFPFLLFWLNLTLCGWWIGMLLITFLLRFGPSGEHLGWMLAFVLAPFVCVYYPVASLPEWMQGFSWSIPPTYVFEGLRDLLATQQFNWLLFYKGFAINLVLLAVSAWNVGRELRHARQHGGLFVTAE